MNVVIIPARLSSKRIKKKNIKLFFNKPIISYVIREAIKSNAFDEVVVSTESKNIKIIAEKFGASVPFLRDLKLSRDDTPVRDVVIDAIHKLEKIKKKKTKNICCLFPTSVLINRKEIKNLFNLHKKINKYIYSACSYEHPIQRSFQIDKLNRPEPYNNKFLKYRTQDLKKYYYDAGQFYIGSRNHFKKGINIFSKKSFPIIYNRNQICDIDTPNDWEEAKIKYAIKYKKKR